MNDKFFKQLDELSKYMKNDLPEIIGRDSVNFFAESFQNEGFTDSSLVKWQEVKRRINTRDNKKESATRKILTGTKGSGELGDSLTFYVEDMSIYITSDKDYAAAHNFGTTTAGRGNNTTIPQRQFVGPSEKLFEDLKNTIENDINRIIKK